MEQYQGESRAAKSKIGIEIAKTELLHQVVTGGRASHDENDPEQGSYWTVSDWDNFCVKARDTLAKLECPEEEIGRLIQEASDKVHLEDGIVSYSGRVDLD